MNVILSVTDKTGIVDLARGLVALDATLYATGGTAALLQREGLVVTEVGDLTGVGELLGGRVKTLSAMVFGGLLARRSCPGDLADLERLGAPLIDLVVCNLYRFDPLAASYEDGIDIGGHAMIRAAAKNSATTAVLVDPADYVEYLRVRREGAEDENAAFRRRLAAKAWRVIARLDEAIAARTAEPDDADTLRIEARRHRALRYGENPHQEAAWWRFEGPGLHDAALVEGKELSYNNLLDLSAAAALVADLGPNSAAIIKHQNPCGAAALSTIAESLAGALECDPAAAYGGIVALAGPLDGAAAELLRKRFIEVIVAPEITPEARAVLEKKKNLRLVEWTPQVLDEIEVRCVPGGILTQTPDRALLGESDAEFRVLSKRVPDSRETDDLRIAFIVAKHVRSNAIVLVKDRMTVGVGAGQMNRADAVRIAIEKAGARRAGSVMASDGFLPFADGLAEADGVTAVIQPGGSIRDDEVIVEADRRGLALLFTGVRHFRH